MLGNFLVCRLQEGRRHRIDNYTGTQLKKKQLSHALILLLKLYRLIQLAVLKFQHIRGNYVYHHWDYTSIYRDYTSIYCSLSYPCMIKASLHMVTIVLVVLKV